MSTPIFVAEDDELRLIVRFMEQARDGGDVLFLARRLRHELRDLDYGLTDETPKESRLKDLADSFARRRAYRA